MVLVPEMVKRPISDAFGSLGGLPGARGQKNGASYRLIMPQKPEDRTRSRQWIDRGGLVYPYSYQPPFGHWGTRHETEQNQGLDQPSL